MATGLYFGKNTETAIQAFAVSERSNLLNVVPGTTVKGASLMECGEDGDLTFKYVDGTTVTVSFLAGANWSYGSHIESVDVVSGLFHFV